MKKKLVALLSLALLLSACTTQGTTKEKINDESKIVETAAETKEEVKKVSSINTPLTIAVEKASEVKSETVKELTNVETKQEIKQETKQEVKPEMKQETSTEIKEIEAKPVAKTETRTVANRETKTETRSVTKPVSKPAISTSTSSSKPVSKSASSNTTNKSTEDDSDYIELKRDKEESVPFETEYREDDSLLKGETKVIRNGQNGLIIYKQVARGKISGTTTELVYKTVSSETVKEPVNKIVAQGTREPEPEVLSNSITVNGNTITFSQSSISWFEDDVYEDKMISRNSITTSESSSKNILIGPSFNRYDNQPSYFMGHNPGSMAPISDLSVGDIVTITDSNGDSYDYRIIDKADFNISEDFVNGGGSALYPLHTGNNYSKSLPSEAVYIQFCMTGARGWNNQVFLAVPN